MLERKKPFAKLGIDFLEQERRRDAEYAKLDRMEKYAKSRRCRQLEILDYFGDPAKKKCGLCDACGGIEPIAAAGDASTGEDPNPPQVIEAVRMVLAGVARMCQRGQYGKRLLAGMLVGSTSAKVTKLGLNRLSTYGLLKRLTEDEAIELIDALLRQRLLSQVEVDRFKPVMQLTPRGEQVMRGDVPLADVLSLSGALRQKLCGLPTTQRPAKPAKTLPAAPSESLDELDFDPFADEEAQERAEADFEFKVQTASMAASAATASTIASPSLSTHAPVNHVAAPHYWTWRVMHAGFSAAECREIRRLDEDTFCDHVLRSARDGRPIDAAWVLTREQLATLSAAVGDGSPERLQAVLARLPTGIKYRDVQVYLLSRGISSA
jgi:ATP-dependent DNA helicase RecQ